MSNLTFWAGGRRRRLFRKRASGSFYIRFEHKGQKICHSTGTTIDFVARDRAKAKIEAVMNGDALALRASKVRSEWCTLREIALIYIERFGTDARRKRTARGNVGALEKIARLGSMSGFDNARSTCLTGEVIRNFEAAELERIERDRAGNMLPESELRIRTSICSVVRQARSIFKKSCMNWYADLALPDLEDFRRQGVQAPDRPKPRPLDDGVIEAIDTASRELMKSDLACYSAHLLFRWLGLRNCEIKSARRTWIDRTQMKLGVIYRPEEGFKPKKKTERWVPIGANVLSMLDQLYRPSLDGDFLVPASSPTERAKIVNRRHAKWAGQWIKERTKVSYELRRQAGSEIYRNTGRIEAVMQFLGHADMKTTLDWYWYDLNKTPALDMHCICYQVAKSGNASLWFL